MQCKSPLTRADLRAIQDRNPDSADVRTLRWEVKRMRACALYVDLLQRMIGALPGQQGDLLKLIRRHLVKEPCVKVSPRCTWSTITWLVGYVVPLS